MNYELAKYKNQWAIFSKVSNCFVLFGSKKRLIKRIKELNEAEKQKGEKFYA